MTHDNHPEHSDITNDMWTQIDEIVASNRDIPGSVIGVLRECQDVVGYLPIKLIDYISYGLNLSRSEVFGVASFYSLFSFEPKGRHLIKVCMGTACYVRGAEKVLDEFKRLLDVKVGETTPDGKFSVSSLRCVGACGLAPVVTVGEKVYGRVAPEDVKDILAEYK